jgi:hypothetical protein
LARWGRRTVASAQRNVTLAGVGVGGVLHVFLFALRACARAAANWLSVGAAQPLPSHRRVRTSGPHVAGSPASRARVCIWVPPQLVEHAPHCDHGSKVQEASGAHATLAVQVCSSMNSVSAQEEEVAARVGGSENRTRVCSPLPQLVLHGDQVLLDVQVAGRGAARGAGKKGGP